MGFWSELFVGPESSAPAPQVRADVPAPSDSSTALVISPRDAAANAVTPGDALGMVAVYRATQIISTSVMQISIDAYRDGELIEPRPLLLRQPDPDMSRAAFLETTALCLALNGNAYWRIFRDNQGRVTSARTLNPRDVTIKQDTQGTVTGYDHLGVTYRTNDIKHLSLMRVPGTATGRGPIQAAQAELRGALDTRDYAAHWFTESGVPTGLLTSKGPLNADQAIAAKARWTETQGGYRGVAVLGGDFSYQPVYLSPADAQFIEGQSFNTTAIARLFGIPAGLMLASVEGSSMTYSNISQAWTEFSRFTLARYTVEIEQALSSLLPRGTDARFNMEALLRPDTTTRYALHTQALTSGFMSVNEVRDLEGLPPVPGGDFPTDAELAEQKAQFEQPADEPVEEEPADV